MPKMKSIVLSPFRILHYVVIDLIGRAASIYKLGWFRIKEYKSWDAGLCKFYGPPDFLKLSANAVHLLSSLDSQLHGSLIQTNLTFWYEPGQNPMVFKRSFGISDPFIKWGEQGIIFCLVFEFLETELIWKQRYWPRAMMDQDKMSKNMHRLVREWLQKRCFPTELIGSAYFGVNS
jgi:hypothetical protein